MDLTAIDRLSEELGRAAHKAGAVFATAESCTGGGIAAAITDIPGSSAWFDRGFVTYSNAAKTALIGVKEETLKAHGAVSEETAHEMAVGALTRSLATAAVSVTGMAGPTGAVPGKPVGTVCFGFAERRNGKVTCRTETMHFTGDRAEVRQQTVAHALKGLLTIVKAA